MQVDKPTLESLKEKFITKAEGYSDQIVNPTYLDAVETENGTVYDMDHPDNKDKTILSFSESAFGQLLNKIGIPAPFYNRCPSRLQVVNFEYFNNEYDKDYFFRFDNAIQKGYVRAVLSDRYSVIDDLDLFNIVFDILQDRTDITYRCLQYDDKVTRLIINFDDCTGEHNGRKYVAGLSITNSETGHSSVWIEPVVHIRECSFYSRRILRGQGFDCRIVHRGKLAQDRVRPMVEKAKEIAQVGILQLAEAFASNITRDHALRSASSIDALPSRFVQILEEEWAEEREVIKAEAARRIVLFAQELPLFQRIQVEQAAGKMLGLFKNYKNRFSDMIQEINNDRQRIA